MCSWYNDTNVYNIYIQSRIYLKIVINNIQKSHYQIDKKISVIPKKKINS